MCICFTGIQCWFTWVAAMFSSHPHFRCWCFHVTLRSEHSVISAELCYMLLPVKVNGPWYILWHENSTVITQHKMDTLMFGMWCKKSIEMHSLWLLLKLESQFLTRFLPCWSFVENDLVMPLKWWWCEVLTPWCLLYFLLNNEFTIIRQSSKHNSMHRWPHMISTLKFSVGLWWQGINCNIFCRYGTLGQRWYQLTQLLPQTTLLPAHLHEGSCHLILFHTLKWWCSCNAISKFHSLSQLRFHIFETELSNQSLKQTNLSASSLS